MTQTCDCLSACVATTSPTAATTCNDIAHLSNIFFALIREVHFGRPLRGPPAVVTPINMFSNISDLESGSVA